MLLDHKQISLLSWFSSAQSRTISKDRALNSSRVILGEGESPYFLLNSLISLGLLDYTQKGCLRLSQSMVLRNKDRFVGINLPIRFSQNHFSILTDDIVQNVEVNTSIPIVSYKPMAWKYAPNISSIIREWELYDISYIDINELEQLSFGGWKNAIDTSPGVYRFKNTEGSYRLIRLSNNWYKLPSATVDPFALDISFICTNPKFELLFKPTNTSEKGLEVKTYLFPPILLRLLIHSVFFNCHFSNGYRSLILNEYPKQFSISNFKKNMFA